VKEVAVALVETVFTFASILGAKVVIVENPATGGLVKEQVIKAKRLRLGGLSQDQVCIFSHTLLHTDEPSCLPDLISLGNGSKMVERLQRL
jgi:hypothetical protein